MNFPTDDRYVRFTFADTHRMAGLLREFLPQDILQHLDLDRLRRLHENQVHNTLRETRDDLNLECPIEVVELSIENGFKPPHVQITYGLLSFSCYSP